MPRADLTPDSVIQAAGALADAEGFPALTVSALARRLGVQPASLYGHVRDRAALLDGVHHLALDLLADRVALAIAGRAGRDALTALAEAHRDLARERPGLWAALQHPASDSTAASDGARRVAELIAAVLRGYALPADELVHATRFLGATVSGFIALADADAYSRRSDPISLSWERAMDGTDRALRSWPGAAASPGRAPRPSHDHAPEARS